MSEKLYAFLLRLFPSRFRQSYGEDALQLFRDRARHETGLPSRLRLWLDLLADLAISVPREYFYAQPELLSASAGQTPGSPSFHVLDNDAPRPGALVFGFALSVAALLTFSTLLNQGGQHRALRASASPRQSFASRATRHPASASPQAADDSSFSVAGETSQQAFASASASPAATTNAELPSMQNAQPTAVVVTPSTSPFFAARGSLENLQPDASSKPGATQDLIDAFERHRVITGATAALQQHYPDREIARKMAESLITHERRGDDNAAANGPIFATLLTRQMRDISNDLHLDVAYSGTPLPDNPDHRTPQAQAAYRDFLLQNNCTFAKVELLPGNIGYLRLDSFPELATCRKTAVAAMHQLNRANALIFDLRDNRGGEPQTVSFFASYLFDHPEYFYNPRENTSSASWTDSPVPGNLLADKPVYILTSSHTFSGAEQFCYDLKMLKRATLIGETTGGGAHAGVFHRLDDHFGIGIPEATPINPYSPADWAEVGVRPDVKVPAADALATAQKLALAKLQQK